MFDSMTIYTWAIIAIDLAIAIVAISVLRQGAGILFGVNTTDELANRDNFAFGVALAGGVVAVALVLASAGSGETSESLLTEALAVSAYAALGVVLLKVGMLINDAIVFSSFSLRTSIAQSNMSASIVQSSNLMAMGILIYGAIHWVEGFGWEAMASTIIVFLLAQLVVLGVTRYRAAIYAKRHSGESWQQAIEAGNSALAIRYAGHLLGVALASSSAGGMITYIYGLAWQPYFSWLGYAIAISTLLTGFAWFARSVILRGVNVVEEVDEQANVGVAAIEAAIFIGIGLVIKMVIG